MQTYILGVENECIYEVLGQEYSHCLIKNETVIINFANKKIHFRVHHKYRCYKILLRFKNILSFNFTHPGKLVIICEGRTDEIIRVTLQLKNPLHFVNHALYLLKYSYRLPFDALNSLQLENKTQDPSSTDTPNQTTREQLKCQFYKGKKARKEKIDFALKLFKDSISEDIKDRVFVQRVQKYQTLCILYRGERKIGAACIEVRPRTHLSVIEYIAIVNKERGKGYSKMMLQEIEDYSRVRNSRVLGLQAISEERVTIFGRLGFEQVRACKEKQKFGWNGKNKKIIIMEKRIAEK